MNEYFILIKRPAPAQNVPTPAIEDDANQRWGRYLQQLGQSGQLVTTHQLEYHGVQLRGAEAVASPVSMETEAVIGWMVVKATDMEQATALANGVPTLGLWGGTCEIRPVVSFGR